MRIGEVARQTGASVRSLRYYEEQGLITAARSASAQRHYADDVVARVRLIRQLFAAGLNSATIAALLPCVDAPSAHVTHESLATLRREHDRIGGQIQELEATRHNLQYLIDSAQDHLVGQTVGLPATG